MAATLARYIYLCNDMLVRTKLPYIPFTFLQNSKRVLLNQEAIIKILESLYIVDITIRG